jgi:prepilin-type processing-associated H-X9-DG protein
VIELLVVVTIIGALMAILLPNLAAALEQARRAQCAANLRGIGQSMRVYSARNNGRLPSVYKEATLSPWGQTDWTAEHTEIADAMDNEGKDHEEMEDYQYRCNLSCWWLMIRQGLSQPGVFICPSADQWADDSITNYDRWWSFKDLRNVSYSYQSQVGRGTRENGDPMLIIAADVNPFRADVYDEPSPRWEDRANVALERRQKLNSPNHDFDGQNCLYLDGHVMWQTTPQCGIGGNNIWVQSSYHPDEDEPWMDHDGTYVVTKGGGPGAKKDTWLVP